MNSENWKPRVCRVIEELLSAVLIGATVFLFVQAFRFGTERDHDRQMMVHGGHFVNAVCAVLSYKKYGAGEYVCTHSAWRDMQVYGLSYEPQTLERFGKTWTQLGQDTAFVNSALKALFSQPRLVDSGDADAIGWGMDGGYQDFVRLSFDLFGTRLESLYLTFFLLLAIATCTMSIQFFRQHFALLCILLFYYVLVFFLPYLDSFEVYLVTDARFLSMLAILPVFHIAFLIAYRISASRQAVVLAIPQAILIATVTGYRATAYWTVIFLAAYCLAISFRPLLRKDYRALVTALVRCWPAALVFSCLAIALVVTTAETDKRLHQTGGMRGHAFWQPMYYNLQFHPDWGKKYSAKHGGTTGDETTTVAVKSYLERHPEAVTSQDYRRGSKEAGLTQVAYEKFTRAAFLEFARNDLRYMAELKYYNAVTLLHIVTDFLRRIVMAIHWQLLVLGACVAVVLCCQVNRNKENSRGFLSCAGILIGCCVTAAFPTWATVTTSYAAVDTAILAGIAFLASAVAACGLLGAVLIRKAARASPTPRNLA